MLTDRAPYAHGNIDTCHPCTGGGHGRGSDGAFARGTRAHTRAGHTRRGTGTVTSRDRRRRRPDHSARRRGAARRRPIVRFGCGRIGFEGWIDGRDTLMSRSTCAFSPVSVNRPSNGSGRPSRSSRRRNRSLPSQASGQSVRGRIRRLADTRPEPFPAGWTGRRSIRSGAAIEISGWVLDVHGDSPEEIVVEISGRASCVAFPTQRYLEGEATTVAGAGTPSPQVSAA